MPHLSFAGVGAASRAQALLQQLDNRAGSSSWQVGGLAQRLPHSWTLRRRRVTARRWVLQQGQGVSNSPSSHSAALRIDVRIVIVMLQPEPHVDQLTTLPMPPMQILHTEYVIRPIPAAIPHPTHLLCLDRSSGASRLSCRSLLACCRARRSSPP